MRLMCFLLVVLVLCGGVFAADDGWGDVNVGDEEAGSVGVDNENVGDEAVVVDEDLGEYASGIEADRDSGRKGKYWTRDFYVALGIGIFILIIIGVVVWLGIRGPKNKWDRQEKQEGKKQEEMG